MGAKAAKAISNGLAGGRHWAGSGRKWCLDCRARVRHLKVFLIARLNERWGLPADLEFGRSRGAGADLTFPQQLRQLGDVGRNPPRLVARKIAPRP